MTLEPINTAPEKANQQDESRDEKWEEFDGIIREVECGSKPACDAQELIYDIVLASLRPNGCCTCITNPGALCPTCHTDQR